MHSLLYQRDPLGVSSCEVSQSDNYPRTYLEDHVSPIATNDCLGSFSSGYKVVGFSTSISSIVVSSISGGGPLTKNVMF